MRKTLPELIAAAKRELALRKNVYPGWVLRGKLKPEKAEHEVACMADIVDLLEKRENDEREAMFQRRNPGLFH